MENWEFLIVHIMAQATARAVYKVLGYVNVSTVLLGQMVEIISIVGSPEDRILGISLRNTNQDNGQD